jgi:CubicO group peptidase (beta-lactamase class C family)
MRSRALQVFSFALLIILVQGVPVSAESHGISQNSIIYFPDTNWAATTPEEQGMSSSVLDDMMQFIEDSDAPIRGLVVTRNGYIVKEQYWNYYTENTTHQIFSCTKSFTGTLIGIALKEGFIGNVSQRVLDFFPEMTIQHMDSRKGNMTLEHVLTMTTGLDWNEWNNSYNDATNMYRQMFEGPNPIQFFLDLPMAYEPGTHWVYTTGASHLLSAIINRATGMSTRAFAEQYLFGPLNMTVGSWNIDPQGIHNGGTQLYVSARSMAKLGLLYLNNGTWDGQEILSEEYVTRATTALVETHLDSDYGYQWWVNTANGLYSAQGSEGQYIFVSPEKKVVVSIIARADEPGEDISEDILLYIQQSLVDGFGDRLEILLLVAGAGIGLVVAVVAFAVLRKQKS